MADIVDNLELLVLTHKQLWDIIDKLPEQFKQMLANTRTPAEQKDVEAMVYAATLLRQTVDASLYNEFVKAAIVMIFAFDEEAKAKLLARTDLSAAERIADLQRRFNVSGDTTASSDQSGGGLFGRGPKASGN